MMKFHFITWHPVPRSRDLLVLYEGPSSVFFSFSFTGFYKYVPKSLLVDRVCSS